MNELYQRLEVDKILKMIAHHASFSLGKEAVLESEFQASSLKLQRDLDRLADAMRLLEEEKSLSFSGLSDTRIPLQKAMKLALLQVDEIVAIAKTMQASARLLKEYQAMEASYPELDDLFLSLEINGNLLDYLQHSFGQENKVLDRASSELGQVRKSIRLLEQKIDQESQKFLKTHADMLSENVVSLQEGRQTFLMKPSEKNKLKGTVYGQSASGQSVYFEPEFLSRMHAELHGLKLREEEEMLRICQEASSRIAYDADQLLANLETLSIIDGLFAKAKWGRAHDGIVAKLNKKGLYLEDARHPLIDPDEVVANSYRLQDPHRTIIISGPNTGGKSVSLKTIGLSVVLTMLACPVLASQADVMMVDGVYVDIGDQQSIEKSLSSFSAHLSTLKKISEQATDRSLILLDELGSQTDPIEGESLAMATLDFFREKGSWIVATTHFSRMKKYATQHDDILVASMDFNLKTLAPSYRYREDVLGDSNALAIAARMGLNPRILDAAFKYKSEGQYQEDRLIEKLEERLQKQSRQEEILKLRKEEVSRKLKRIKKEERQMHEDFARKERRLKEEFNQRIDQIVLKAEKEIEQIKQEQARQENIAGLKQLRALKKEKKEAPIPQFKLGDRVRIKNTQQQGEIIELNKKEAMVELASMRMQVPLSQLEYAPMPKKKPKAKVQHRNLARPRVALECNVIGLRVAEALPIIDKYIDDCVLNNLESVRIIHGHGSGRLRSAVHEALRKNKHVKSFELASVYEGGSGATVLKLK